IQITRAATGLAAVNLCRENTFNLILMDIQLHEMDGLAATKLIKQSNPDIPIIAQTAYAMSGEREKCIKAGCDDYISKPINISELLGKIDLLIK
ncbi:MAG: response regulator, partial [Bacteroidetes bacterium]